MLWYNDGPGPDGTVSLIDVSAEAGAWDGGWGWGAKFLDYDNDADLDIVSVNGFISAGQESYWYDLAWWTVLGQDTADARNWPPIGDVPSRVTSGCACGATREAPFSPSGPSKQGSRAPATAGESPRSTSTTTATWISTSPTRGRDPTSTTTASGPPTTG